MERSCQYRPRDPVLRAAQATRLSRRLLMVLMFAGFGVPALSPAVTPAQVPPAAEPGAGRKPDEIKKDIDEAGQGLAEIMPGMDVLMKPAKRAELAPKVLPLMRKLSNLLGEWAIAAPETKPGVLGAQMELRALMALLGDKQADDEIAKFSASADAKEATDAKSWALLIQWVKAQKDPGGQEKLAGDLSALAKAQPDNPMIAQAASLMLESAATPALAEQVEKVVVDELRSPLARQLAQSLAAKRRLAALEGKPLVIEGVTVDGTKFSTAAWKGKVVLVDFWATWCAPCVAEVPTLAKAYADFHGKGLEIVGVSSDRDADDLNGFLAKNKGAAWPQLFDPASPGRHPLAERYGVDSLPTMFLIDRKGVVRTVNAGENYGELIPKLLAEKE
jgi:thiol-disulfide isomerase/thioredoxin